MKIFPPKPKDPNVFLPNENKDPSVVNIILCNWPHLISDILCP